MIFKWLNILFKFFFVKFFYKKSILGKKKKEEKFIKKLMFLILIVEKLLNFDKNKNKIDYLLINYKMMIFDWLKKIRLRIFLKVVLLYKVLFFFFIIEVKFLLNLSNWRLK